MNFGGISPSAVTLMKHLPLTRSGRGARKWTWKSFAKHMVGYFPYAVSVLKHKAITACSNTSDDPT